MPTLPSDRAGTGNTPTARAGVGNAHAGVGGTASSDRDDAGRTTAPAIASHPDPTSPDVLPPSPTYPAGTPSNPNPDLPNPNPDLPGSPPTAPGVRASPASAAIEGAADGLADGLEREDIGGNVHGALGQVDEALADRPSPRARRLRDRLERIDEKVETVIDKTRVRARAVAETARRARDAPPKVAGDLTDAAKTYATGIAVNVGFAIAAAFIGLLALTVLTVGMVQGLNDAWGAPRGTFLVAGAYFLVAFALYSTGKGRARTAQLKARAHLLDAKGEIQRVARPMQRAFAGAMDAEHQGVASTRPERPSRQRDGFEVDRQRTPDAGVPVKPYRGGPH